MTSRAPLPDGLPLSDDRPTLLCFDLDGCLVDSDEAFSVSMNAALAEHGVMQMPVAVLRELIGPPLEVSVAGLLEELLADPDLLQPVVDSYRAHYRTEGPRRTTAHARVRAVIEGISRVHTIGVVTSKPQRFAVPIVDAVGLRRHVDFVVGPGTDGPIEPKADTLERAIDLHGDGLAVVMVGDRRFDVEAGRRHGAVTIGVTWGNGSRDELEAAGADVICDDAYDLAEALTTGRFQPADDAE